MQEISLTKNRKILFNDNSCIILRTDAITIDSMKVEINYNRIESVNYIPRKINWIKSVLNFMIFTVIESVDNPVSGKVKIIEIKTTDNNNRYLDVDSLSDDKIESIVKEFNRRIN
jgi:hypothetical protein